MPLLTTDALVLHAFDYMESSRILRLVTREAGVQSALAKGARRAQRKYGSALDLFAEGSAQLYTKEGRELHTMASFDVTRARPELAADLGRFTAASAVAELTLRFSPRDEAHPALYGAVLDVLDALATAEPGRSRETGTAGMWRLIGELGFAPALDVCAVCHAEVARGDAAMFSHPAGGVLCGRCVRTVPGSRTIPASARDSIRAWLAGEIRLQGEDAEARAHQRLLREFVTEHLADGRPLRAFELWETERWEGAPASVGP